MLVWQTVGFAVSGITHTGGLGPTRCSWRRCLALRESLALPDDECSEAVIVCHRSRLFLATPASRSCLGTSRCKTDYRSVNMPGAAPLQCGPLLFQVMVKVGHAPEGFRQGCLP